MQYPLYVHRTDGMRYCGSFPDFPRADASGASFEELERNARDSVQRLYDRSEHLIPAPSDDLHALQMLDMDDGSGLWIFVEIDLAKVTSRSVYLQLSLNQDVLRDIDEAALALRVTRPAFIALACMREIDRARGDGGATSSMKIAGLP